MLRVENAGTHIRGHRNTRFSRSLPQSLDFRIIQPNRDDSVSMFELQMGLLNFEPQLFRLRLVRSRSLPCPLYYWSHCLCPSGARQVCKVSPWFGLCP